MFRDDGHELVVVHSGEGALRQLDRDRPDAIFLDVRLPGMSGIAVLREIRSADPDLPVIVITGYATLGEIQAARQLGVTEIIEKPFILKHFSEALARASGIHDDPSGR